MAVDRRRLVLQTLLVLSALTAPIRALTSRPGSVQVVIPDAIMNAAIDKLLPSIAEKIDKTPLPTCCYDDVGASHVHLNFQNMKVENAAVDLKLLSSPSGMTIDGQAALTATGFYRLCLHDDPFSKHACSTLFGCKGNFEITPNVSLSLEVELAAAGGIPKVAISKCAVHLNSMPSNFCGKIRDEISKSASKISAAGCQAIDSEGQEAIAKAISQLIDKVDFNMFNFTSHRYISNGTHTITGGIVIQGDLLLTDNITHQLAPWLPRYPLPEPASVEGNVVAIYVADSLISNALFPEYKDGLFHFKTSKVEAGLHWNLSFEATDNGPYMHINQTDQLLFIPIILEAYSTARHFVTNFTAAVGLDIRIALQNGSSLSLGLQIKDDLGLSAVSSSCDENCHKILDSLLLEADLAIPLIDAILKNKSITVDLPPSLTLHNFTISYGSGFFEIAVQPSIPSRQTDIIELSYLDFFNSLIQATIKCPSISGAHQDSCI